MPSHPIDFEVFGGPAATPQMKQIFAEKRRIQRWLEIEAVLAQVQAELGIIPEQAAAEIARKAELKHIDLKKVRENYLQARHSLVPLLKEFKSACEGGAGQYVHYGATTQDILDTAEILEVKEALNIIYQNLRELEGLLLDLAQKHAATPMIGRTHGQQALPTTFGFKVAVWVCELRRHIQRLLQSAPRLLVGQLSGGVGTFAALGEQGQTVAARTMERLGLGVPPIAWHNSRDNIGELACQLALVMASLGKIANEIFQLQKTEMGELAEPAGEKSVGSSTMPHKRNPVRCQRVVALSRQVRHLANLVVESAGHEHERDVRCLAAEWSAVPEICIYSGAALQHMINIIAGLGVDPERMLANLHIQGEMIQTEWLLFRLAPDLGKMQAHDKLHQLVSVARRSGQSLKAVIQQDDELNKLLSDEDLQFLDQPERYLGLAPEVVAQVVAQTRAEREQDPEGLGEEE